MGAITSKKNLRHAVKRNQAKRIARETFRKAQASLTPVDLVIVALKKANDASKEELRRCLEQLFTKLRG
jgi:ribonuclease P protein component